MSLTSKTMTVCLVLQLAACLGDPDGPEPVDDQVKMVRLGQILTQPPAEADPEGYYLFYLHGRIIEEQGPRPEHPRYGIYEYQAILEALVQQGMVVISEVRASGADPWSYAEQVIRQVEELIAAGVPAEQITVVGFSKGGAIAILTSAMLDNDQVNYVFLAACGSWLEARSELTPHGRILSLYEQTDQLAGSCQPFFERRNESLIHHELELQIGGGHGAFYRPDARWLEPLAEWLTAPTSPAGAAASQQ
jgi:dienelactone hydrolase